MIPFHLEGLRAGGEPVPGVGAGTVLEWAEVQRTLQRRGWAKTQPEPFRQSVKGYPTVGNGNNNVVNAFAAVQM
jgi:hypothetical protein